MSSEDEYLVLGRYMRALMVSRCLLEPSIAGKVHETHGLGRSALSTGGNNERLIFGWEWRSFPPSSAFHCVVTDFTLPVIQSLIMGRWLEYATILHFNYVSDAPLRAHWGLSFGCCFANRACYTY